MGTITVNVKDEVEQSFRKKVIGVYGKKKGSLGKALMEAMSEWTKKKEYLDICMSLLEEGVNMGKMKYKDREELHDRF